MNKVNKKQVLIDINNVLDILSKPLIQEEINNGWTVECQFAMTKLFKDIRSKLECDEAIAPLFLARGLDAWGVSGGALSEKIAVISCNLRVI